MWSKLKKIHYRQWQKPILYRAVAFVISLIVALAVTVGLTSMHFSPHHQKFNKYLSNPLPNLSIKKTPVEQSPVVNQITAHHYINDESFHFVDHEFISLSNLKRIRDHIQEITWQTSNGIYDYAKQRQILTGAKYIKKLRKKYRIGPQLMGQLADLASNHAEIKPVKVNGIVSDQYLLFSLNRNQDMAGEDWQHFLFFEKVDDCGNDGRLKFIGYFHGLDGEYANLGAVPEFIKIRDKTWFAMDSLISAAGGGGVIRATLWIDLSHHRGNSVVLEYISEVGFHAGSFNYISYEETARIADAIFENGNYIVALTCRLRFKPDEYYRAIGLRDLIVEGKIRYILNQRSGCFKFDWHNSDKVLRLFYQQCCDERCYVFVDSTLTANCDAQPEREFYQPKDILLNAFYPRLMRTVRSANYEQLALFGSLLKDCQASKKKTKLQKLVGIRYSILDKQEQHQ